MNWFNQIEDRFLMVVLTATILAAFLATRDALFSDLLKYSIGATFGVLVARANKQIVVTGTTNEQAKALVADFTKN